MYAQKHSQIYRGPKGLVIDILQIQNILSSTEYAYPNHRAFYAGFGVNNYKFISNLSRKHRMVLKTTYKQEL